MGVNASNTLVTPEVTPSNLIKEDFHGFTVLIKECTELAEFGQELRLVCILFSFLTPLLGRTFDTFYLFNLISQY